MSNGFIAFDTSEEKRHFAEALMGTLDLGLSAEIDLQVSMRTVIHPGYINPFTISEVANFIRNTGRYEVMEAGGIGTATHTFIIRKKEKKSWWERKPIREKWLAGFITFLFSVTASTLILLLSNRKTAPDNTQQIQQLTHQDSVLNNLQNALRDSVAMLRADTSIRNH